MLGRSILYRRCSSSWSRECRDNGKSTTFGRQYNAMTHKRSTQTILCFASNCQLLKVGTWLANPIHQHLRNLCEDDTDGSQIIQPRKPENFQNFRKQVGWGAWLIYSLQTSCPTLILLSFKTGQDSLLLCPPNPQPSILLLSCLLPVRRMSGQCILNHCQCCILHTQQLSVLTAYSTIASAAYSTVHTQPLPVLHTAYSTISSAYYILDCCNEYCIPNNAYLIIASAAAAKYTQLKCSWGAPLIASMY